MCMEALLEEMLRIDVHPPQLMCIRTLGQENAVHLMSICHNWYALVRFSGEKCTALFRQSGRHQHMNSPASRIGNELSTFS